MSDDLANLTVQNNLLQRVERLETIARQATRASVNVQVLSDITDDIGEVRAGDFLTASSGYPDDGEYTGGFMSAAGYVFNEAIYHTGGVYAGALQWGANNTDGKFYFAGGAATLDGSGITINEPGMVYRHQATAGGETRQLDMGLFVTTGGTTPSAGWQYYEPGVEAVINGDFATNDLTGWTATNTDAGNTISASTGICEFSARANTGSPLTLTSDRTTAIVGGGVGNFSIDVPAQGFAPGFTSADYVKCVVNWYDDPSAGSLVRTDTIFDVKYPNTASSNYSQVLTSPATSESCEIVITVGSGVVGAPVTLLSVDDVSFGLTTVTGQLYFDTDAVLQAVADVEVTGSITMDDGGIGMWATTALITPPQWIVTASDGTTVRAMAWARNSDVLAGYGYMVLSAANANDGDRYRSSAVLKAGTYDILIHAIRSDDCGKFDVYIDGTKVTSTPFDDYNSSTDYHEVFTAEDVAITKSGNHLVELRINGKNGSSSDYRLFLSMGGVVFVPADVADF